MLASLASASDGAFEDDPLTSPSFRPTPDSRSYRGARRSTRADGTGTSANGSPAAAADYGNGARHAAGHGGNGYASGNYGNGGNANGGPHDQAPANGAYHLPDRADPGYAYTPAFARCSPTAGQLAQHTHAGTRAGEPIRQLRG